MKKRNKPTADQNPSKKDSFDLENCTSSPEYAEHARPNEPPEDACDDGRGSSPEPIKEIKELKHMTEGEQLSNTCDTSRQKKMTEKLKECDNEHSETKNRSECYDRVIKEEQNKDNDPCINS